MKRKGAATYYLLNRQPKATPLFSTYNRANPLFTKFIVVKKDVDTAS